MPSPLNPSVTNSMAEEVRYSAVKSAIPPILGHLGTFAKATNKSDDGLTVGNEVLSNGHGGLLTGERSLSNGHPRESSSGHRQDLGSSPDDSR